MDANGRSLHSPSDIQAGAGPGLDSAAMSDPQPADAPATPADTVTPEHRPPSSAPASSAPASSDPQSAAPRRQLHLRTDGPGLGADARGAERSATAVAIARGLRGVQPDGPRSYLLVNGYTVDGWGCGLLAAGLSADAGAPVLLTQADQAPAPTAAEVAGCADRRVDLRRDSPAGDLSDALLAALDARDEEGCQVS